MAKIITAGKGSSKYNIVIAKSALSQKNLMPALNAKNKILVVTDSGYLSLI
jgi:3-dehydroquinate synthetase